MKKLHTSHTETYNPSQKKPPKLGDLSVYQDLDEDDEYDDDDLDLYSDDRSERAYSFAIRTTSVVLLVLIVFLAASYCVGAIYYMFHFYPHSTINGIDVSGLTTNAATELLKGDNNSRYELLVHLREGDIKLTQSDLKFSTSIEPRPGVHMSKQDCFKWIFEMYDTHEYESVVSTNYDDMSAKMAIGIAFNQVPEDHDGTVGTLEMTADGLLQYVPGQASTRRDEAVGRELILEAIKAGRRELDLRNTDFYTNAYFVAYDEAIQRRADEWNSLCSTTLTYSSSAFSYTFGPSEIKSYLTLDEEHNIIMDRASLKQFIADHASVPPMSVLTFHGSPVNETLFSFAFDSWTGTVADKIISDFEQVATDGTVPELYSGSVLNVGKTLEINKSTSYLSVYDNDAVIATFPISLGTYTTWSSVMPGIYSGSSPRDGIFVFSNGLLLGSDPSSVNFVIPNLEELWQYVKGNEFVYLSIIETQNTEDVDAAWSNQNIRAEDLHNRTTDDTLVLDLSSADLR